MSEYEEQVKLINYLDSLIEEGHKIKYSAIPASTWTPSWGQKMKNKASGVRPGLPDLFIIINTIPLWIEMKVKGGRLSESQKEWHEALTNAKLAVKTCYSFEEAKRVIDYCLYLDDETLLFAPNFNER